MNNQFWRSPKHKAPRKNTVRKLASPLVIAGLMAAGQFQLIPQAIAAGTAATTEIRNTATATYQDPDGENLTTTSNEVIVTVAEVAVLTNFAQTPIDLNDGSVRPGDTVQFPFAVTNGGNASADIYIPNISNIATTNLNTTTDIDGNPFDDNNGVYVDVTGDGVPDFFLPNGNNSVQGVTENLNGSFSPDPDNVPANPPTFQNGGWVIPGVDADQTITVIVQGLVDSSTTGDQVTVQLGDTGPNDGTPLSQNQADPDDGANNNEVRTVGTGAVNDDREAADTSEPLIVNQEAPRPLALATVLKSVGSVNPGAPNTPSDDVITYNLSFQVESELPFGYDGNFTPAGLTGNALKIDSSTASGEYVLVSDAKPTNAQFAATAPVAPLGWQVVYTGYCQIWCMEKN